MENITIPSNILQIKAADSDSGQNGRFSFGLWEKINSKRI